MTEGMGSASGVRQPAAEDEVPGESTGLNHDTALDRAAREEVSCSSDRQPRSRQSTGGAPATLPDAGRRTPNAVLVLASTSPRRSDLLNRLGIAFEVIPSHVDEETPDLQGLSPFEHARTLAYRKAQRVARQCASRRLVLGADTVVVLDQQILGKPRDEADARRMLGQLSGRWHEVITAVALLRRRPAVSWVGAVRSQVLIRPLSAAAIEAYVATGEPMDKAGAYAAQGHGRQLIAEIRGSYTNVVGLPDMILDGSNTIGLVELIGRWQDLRS